MYHVLITGVIAVSSHTHLNNISSSHKQGYDIKRGKCDRMNHSELERSKLSRIFADEKLRRVLGIKHRICKYNDYHELGHVETKGIEI